MDVFGGEGIESKVIFAACGKHVLYTALYKVDKFIFLSWQTSCCLINIVFGFCWLFVSSEPAEGLGQMKARQAREVAASDSPQLKKWAVGG